MGDNLASGNSKQGMETFSLECRMKSSQHHTFLLFSITDYFFVSFFFSLKENTFSSKNPP